MLSTATTELAFDRLSKRLKRRGLPKEFTDIKINPYMMRYVHMYHSAFYGMAKWLDQATTSLILGDGFICPDIKPFKGSANEKGPLLSEIVRINHGDDSNEYTGSMEEVLQWAPPCTTSVLTGDMKLGGRFIAHEFLSRFMPAEQSIGMVMKQRQRAPRRKSNDSSSVVQKLETSRSKDGVGSQKLCVKNPYCTFKDHSDRIAMCCGVTRQRLDDMGIKLSTIEQVAYARKRLLEEGESMVGVSYTVDDSV